MTHNSQISPELESALSKIESSAQESELRILVEQQSQIRDYVIECLTDWVRINEIITQVKLKIEIIEMIGDDKELMKLYNDLERKWFEISYIWDIIVKLVSLSNIISINQRLSNDIGQYFLDFKGK